jgi:hypothetical protein
MNPWLGKTVTHEGKTWKVKSIRQASVGYECNETGTKYAWAWLSNVAKPADQARLSMRAECFL